MRHNKFTVELELCALLDGCEIILSQWGLKGLPQLSEAVAWEKAVAAGSSMPNAVKFEFGFPFRDIQIIRVLSVAT